MNYSKGGPKWAFFINFELQYGGHTQFRTKRLRGEFTNFDIVILNDASIV